MACRNLEFIRWVWSCCQDRQSLRRSFRRISQAGLRKTQSQCCDMNSENPVEESFRVFHPLLIFLHSLTSIGSAVAGVLPVTIAGVQGLQGCLWHIATCQDLGEGWSICILWLPLSTVWEWASPTKARATCFANSCRWWLPGGLHCWWGLCLHLQSGTERQAEALVWFRFENMHSVNLSQCFDIPLWLLDIHSPCLAVCDNSNRWGLPDKEQMHFLFKSDCRWRWVMPVQIFRDLHGGLYWFHSNTYLLCLCNLRKEMRNSCLLFLSCNCALHIKFFFVWLINRHLSWHFPCRFGGDLCSRLVDIDTCHL